MLSFVRDGKTLMMEHDDGQFELVTEEAKAEFEKAKKDLEEATKTDEEK
jgi:hypothetical protein